MRRGDTKKRHAVWNLYDEFRTTRLSCKYYGIKLQRAERKNFAIELILAATTSGSAIAALTFWTTNTGIAAGGIGVQATEAAMQNRKC